MDSNLFDHVNIDKSRTFVPNGLEEDSQYVHYCRFNEPGEAFECETHCVELTPSTIEANKRFFASEADVPRYAYTMGIRNIMQAKKILLIASGRAKAQALKEALYGPVTPHVPASILQLHADVVVVADEEALELID